MAEASPGRRSGLAPDGRDPHLVPENWAELIDPAEWRLDADGLPSRRAARVIVLRSDPQPAILLVTGHDFAREALQWCFTPGGGILPGEDSAVAACRELAEETGIVLEPADLSGPVVHRRSRFEFHLVTCCQTEEIYLARLGADSADLTVGADGEVDRSGWTEDEHRVLDSLRWWTLEELEAAVGAGLTVYPAVLPELARELLEGWDGRARLIRELD